MTDYLVERDGFGRPLLYPPEGGKKVAYTRPSTMAKWLDDKSGLINWTAAMAMIGMAQSKSVQARVSAIVARGEGYTENRGAFKELVEVATNVAKVRERADYGTAIHEFAELVDSGTLDWGYVPESLKGPLDAYREATECLSVLDSEVFVVIDEKVGNRKLRGAGSLDRVVQHPELGVVIADLKTGAKEPQYPLGVMTQVAIYSRGQRYRDDSFPGSPPFEDGEPNADGTAWRKTIHPDLNESTGLLIHCPLEKVGNKFECGLYALNLEKGWEALLLGFQVQTTRRPPKLERIS